VAQPINHKPLGFEVQFKKLSWWFWGSNHQTVAVGFETQTRKPSTIGFKAKLRETVATGFEAKSGETVVTDFKAKLEDTVQVVLWLNHWQTVDLGFEAQPRNTRSSSSRVQCRPHMASPDLPIARPLSTWPVLDHP
jgi:hypothetical protein